MAFRPLPGYPLANEKGGIEWIGDIDGPVSYVNPSSFILAGQQLNAIDFGFGGFEDVAADVLSSDGVNEVLVVLGQVVATGATQNQPAPPGTNPPAPAVQQAALHWFTGVRGIAGATEVANGTNLSSKSIRLRIRAV